ncbi:Cda9 [Cordylochernes scorpioides]|uniref:Cda9 n=1 Tax=Cordylochernes scorpioides TaxID=51811 RepID=A0ABY6LMM0_9ARAC|nr:Cda9 [Cordylochernes scorpioides]
MRFPLVAAVLAVLAGGAQCRPQFVMLTFDDAVNIANLPTYRDLLTPARRNAGNNCTVKATFFVSHDYTDYSKVHWLYRNGHEIAVHSVSHHSNTDYWRTAKEQQWREEAEGMRKLLVDHAAMPEADIQGHRAPFLQTAGDVTLQALSGFRYDSSYPSRKVVLPLSPYDLKNGFKQDCVIAPCPGNSFPGMWEVPLTGWTREPVTDEEELPLTCSMADACVPYPEGVNDTLDYLKHNFLRHYQSNRAPFPVFLHQAWLRHPLRWEAYLQFVNWLTEKNDVFLVTVRQVLDYLEKPVSLEEYVKQPCRSSKIPPGTKCRPKRCHYPTTKLGIERNLFTCAEQCPEVYPWVGPIPG